MVAAAARLRDDARQLERHIADDADLAGAQRTVGERAQDRAVGDERRRRDPQVAVIEHFVEADLAAASNRVLQYLLNFACDRLAAFHGERGLEIVRFAEQTHYSTWSR